MTDRALLEALFGEMRAIRVLLEAQRRPVGVLSPSDRLVLAQLLPAALAAFGESAFSVSECLDKPDVCGATSRLTAKQLGKLFGRACKQRVVDGYVVQRLGDESGRALWGVTALVSVVHKATKAS